MPTKITARVSLVKLPGLKMTTQEKKVDLYLIAEGISKKDADKHMQRIAHIGKVGRIRIIPGKKRNKYAVYSSKRKISKKAK